MLISAISAFAVGKQHTYDVTVLAYTIFNAILLIILFNSFNKYSNAKSYDMSNINLTKFHFVEKISIVSCSISLVISLYVFYHLNLMVSAEMMTVEEYRYGDLVTATLNRIVGNHWLITLTRLFSPFGYISLFYHFYYLLAKETKKAVVHLVLSFTIVSTGMMALSRSALITYACVYATMLYLYYPLIDTKIRKKMNFVIGSVAFIAATYFMTITTNRFENRTTFYYATSKNKPIVNPNNYSKIYSVCDYGGQWQEYSTRAFEKYDPDYRFWGLYNSSGLIVHLISYINPNINKEIDDKLNKIIGHDRVLFQGVIVRLVFDFGIVGSILFICLYAYFIKKIAPKNGIVAVHKAILYPVILPFPLMFFSGNAFSGMELDIAVIYSVIVFSYLRVIK